MRLTTIEAEGTKRTQVTRCDANLPGFAKAVSFFDIPGKPPPKAGQCFACDLIENCPVE
jgi:hypothetical protein